MSRKKRDVPMPATSSEPEIKHVRLDISAELHRLLRRVAANEDKSMAAFARECLEQAVREAAYRMGIK